MNTPLKIGYSGYTQDFSGPGDRRRIWAYAKSKGHSIQFPERGQDYDLIYLTSLSDIPYWLEYKRRRKNKTKLVFEMIDSLIQSSSFIKNRFRGVLRFAQGQFGRPHFNFNQLLFDGFQLADACVCSTLEQEVIIGKYNKNVHRILDNFDGDFGPGVKETHFDRQSRPIRIVWEGQPYTLENILSIRSALEEIKDQIELHILTDPIYYRFGQKFWEMKTSKILSDLNVKTTFSDWTPEALVRKTEKSHLAIIPIDLNNPLYRGKPENKLVLFLKLGIPVLVSPTPAYKRCVEDLHFSEFLCDHPAKWVQEIKRIGDWKQTDYREFRDKAADGLQAHYSSEILYSKWDKLFQSIT